MTCDGSGSFVANALFSVVLSSGTRSSGFVSRGSSPPASTLPSLSFFLSSSLSLFPSLSISLPSPPSPSLSPSLSSSKISSSLSSFWSPGECPPELRAASSVGACTFTAGSMSAVVSWCGPSSWKVFCGSNQLLTGGEAESCSCVSQTPSLSPGVSSAPVCLNGNLLSHTSFISCTLDFPLGTTPPSPLGCVSCSSDVNPESFISSSGTSVLLLGANSDGN